jgi:hypothetical protein
MGAHPWFYFVPFQDEVQKALEKLRTQEFNAGRYNPVIPFPIFPVDLTLKTPGAKHASIERAIEASGESGTRSILDMKSLSKEAEYFCVAPLNPAVLEELFGTVKPNREMIEENMDFFENIERGQGIYIVLFKDEKPYEILFAGYSFD